MNVRRAPTQLALKVKRRVEKANPGARMDEAAVNLVSIPGTLWDATIFLFEQKGQLVLVGEIGADRPDIPHVYASGTLDPKDKKSNVRVMAKVLLTLSQRIQHDPRFGRASGRIIQLNGAH